MWPSIRFSGGERLLSCFDLAACFGRSESEPPLGNVEDDGDVTWCFFEW